MTVLEVIQRSTAFLAKKGVESPRLQAELLLAQALHLPRMQLYLNFERVLGEPEQDLVRQMVKRRGEREPLQHIIGSTSFCGLEIRVSPAVLIPRPETELLAEQGWIFLNERAASSPALGETGAAPVTDSASRPMALDFGTGSGCLAIALAVKCPGAHLLAVDIEPSALELARQNAALHGMSDRIEFLLGDGLSVLPGTASFDLIAANPPYIPSAEIAQLQPEVRDHDPRRALDGGTDGLDFYRKLAREARPFLKPTGKIMMEFGDHQEQALVMLFKGENWVVEQILSDYTQQPRILIARTQ
ncbi:MAG TPA: peptide chain release factor N(5)-glutamine methyltransferase [Verrucomicrobiae bacterium]|nr:peptide chain release factor N(5)-glutamine methyltransferase [Verrucomicrobiae bacterium]